MGELRAASTGRSQLTKLMVEFLIIQMCLFHVLKRQLEPSSGRESTSTNRSNDQETATAGRGGGVGAKKRLDKRTATPLHRLLKLEAFAHFTYKIYIYFYAVELARFFLIELLSSDFLRDYQLLDCFLLGRFRFIGRTNKISGRIVLVFTICFVSYRLFIFKGNPRFKYYMLEFLMHPYEEVLANELAWKWRQAQSTSSIKEIRNHMQEGLESRLLLRRLLRNSRHKRPSSANWSPALIGANGKQPSLAFYIRGPPNKFGSSTATNNKRRTTANDDDEANWILRPNRTAACWLVLARTSEIMFFVCICVFVVWVGVIATTIGGSIFTELGFELAYPACVDWLQRVQRAAIEECPLVPVIEPSLNSTRLKCLEQGPLPYASLYVAPPRLAHQMDIDDLPAIIPLSNQKPHSTPGLYYLMRVLIDLVENNWWYVEFILVVTSLTYLILVSSLDVILNAREIRRRLDGLISDLTREQLSRSATQNTLIELCRTSEASNLYVAASSDLMSRGRPNFWEPHFLGAPALPGGGGGASLDSQKDMLLIAPLIITPSRIQANNEQEQDAELARRIATIQAILADHFKLVRGYNEFISFSMALILSVWCVYSAVLSTWMASIKSKALEFEFLVTEIGGTFFAVAFFSLAAIARSQNRHLYGQIARAMALDSDGSSTKLRWTTILKFYAPKSMYCFTLLGNTEISWLFCLQVSVPGIYLYLMLVSLRLLFGCERLLSDKFS